MEVDDYVAAAYYCKTYVDKILEVDGLDVHISFFAHREDLSISTTFVIPKVPDEVWVAKENILCIVPRPNKDMQRKRARLVLDETELEMIFEMLQAWVKTNRFFFNCSTNLHSGIFYSSIYLSSCFK